MTVTLESTSAKKRRQRLPAPRTLHAAAGEPAAGPAAPRAARSPGSTSTLTGSASCGTRPCATAPLPPGISATELRDLRAKPVETAYAILYKKHKCHTEHNTPECQWIIDAHNGVRTHMRQLKNWAHAWPSSNTDSTILSCTDACAKITEKDKCTALCQWSDNACVPRACNTHTDSKTCRAQETCAWHGTPRPRCPRPVGQAGAARQPADGDGRLRPWRPRRARARSWVRRAWRGHRPAGREDPQELHQGLLPVETRLFGIQPDGAVSTITVPVPAVMPTGSNVELSMYRTLRGTTRTCCPPTRVRVHQRRHPAQPHPEPGLHAHAAHRVPLRVAYCPSPTSG